MNQNPYESPNPDRAEGEPPMPAKGLGSFIGKIFAGFVIGGWIGIICAPRVETWPIVVASAIAGSVVLGLIKIR